MKDRLFIRMLTGDDLLVEAPATIQWQGRTQRSLFVLLALQPGEPISRDRLAGLLWSESDQTAARGSLSTALHSLRHVLDPVDPDLIRSTNDEIMLDVERETVDWALFERLCARPDVESRLKALELYKGDLLAAFPTPSEAASELLRDKRERLREIAIEIGVDLMTTFEGKGEQDQIKSIVRKILTIEPANEPAHQAMMRAHVATGDRSAALRQYEQCREALDEHYDLHPSADTVALRNKIIEAEAVETAEPAAQTREFTNEDAVSPKLSPKQRRQSVWRRFLPAAFALSALVLALLWFWPCALTPSCDEPTPLHVIVLSLEIEKSDPRADEVAIEIRKIFEETLRQVPEATVITQAPIDAPPSLLGDSFRVIVIVKRSNDRLRIFIELRDSRSIDPLWRDKRDFNVPTLERVADWLESDLVPILLSEFGLYGSSD